MATATNSTLVTSPGWWKTFTADKAKGAPATVKQEELLSLFKATGTEVTQTVEGRYHATSTTYCRSMVQFRFKRGIWETLKSELDNVTKNITYQVRSDGEVGKKFADFTTVNSAADGQSVYVSDDSPWNKLVQENGDTYLPISLKGSLGRASGFYAYDVQKLGADVAGGQTTTNSVYVDVFSFDPKIEKITIEEIIKTVGFELASSVVKQAQANGVMIGFQPGTYTSGNEQTHTIVSIATNDDLIAFKIATYFAQDALNSLFAVVVRDHAQSVAYHNLKIVAKTKNGVIYPDQQLYIKGDVMGVLSINNNKEVGLGLAMKVVPKSFTTDYYPGVPDLTDFNSIPTLAAAIVADRGVSISLYGLDNQPANWKKGNATAGTTKPLYASSLHVANALVGCGGGSGQDPKPPAYYDIKAKKCVDLPKPDGSQQSIFSLLLKRPGIESVQIIKSNQSPKSTEASALSASAELAEDEEEPQQSETREALASKPTQSSSDAADNARNELFARYVTTVVARRNQRSRSRSRSGNRTRSGRRYTRTRSRRSRSRSKSRKTTRPRNSRARSRSRSRSRTRSK